MEETIMAFILTSSAFDHKGEIPRKFTCDGRDISPPLSWHGMPENTRSLALIVDDPDAPDPAAPTRVFVHWLVFDIPASTTSLAEAASTKSLPGATLQGMNDWSRVEYGGPCPPIGRHRYFFKLYALDVTRLSLDEPDKKTLEATMQPHIIGKAELIGTYKR
jgi:Raf kinase inhibitor-like YbhB/YbcL family protein